MPDVSPSIGRYAPYLLSILRIMTALLFMEHGLAKFFGFPAATTPPRRARSIRAYG